MAAILEERVVQFTEKGISEIEYYLSAGKIDESKAILSDLKKNYQNTDDVIYAEAY